MQLFRWLFLIFILSYSTQTIQATNLELCRQTCNNVPHNHLHGSCLNDCTNMPHFIQMGTNAGAWTGLIVSAAILKFFPSTRKLAVQIIGGLYLAGFAVGHIGASWWAHSSLESHYGATL